jgi:predicted nucleotidyltransferase
MMLVKKSDIMKSVNPGSHATSPMNALIAPILVELRQRLEALYGPRLVKMILYGSQARGDAEPGSDIDVLVVLRGLVRPGEEIARTSDIRLNMSLMHDTVISCAYVSSSRYQKERSPFLLNVRREGMAV